MEPSSEKFHQRVIEAAENALRGGGSVGPLELLQHMQLLHPGHVDEWRRGRIETLEEWIQGSPTKLARTFEIFHEWAAARGLKTMQASYSRAGLKGATSLQVTATGDPEQEVFFRTHYAPGDLPPARQRRLEGKLQKAPDLVVFETVSDSVICSECKVEMSKGNLLFMEKGQPLCLSCADLDHLEFLPAGDAALSRRARKSSPLSTVVVRFSRNSFRVFMSGY